MHVNKKLIDNILIKYNYKNDALLKILLETQSLNDNHFVSNDSIRYIADNINVPYSKAHEVFTFFDALNYEPKGKYHIQLCNGTVCNINKKNVITDYLEKTLHINVGETTEDKLFTLEYTPCFGACDISPAIRINKKVYGNLTTNKMENILKKLKENSKYDNQYNDTTNYNSKLTKSLISENFNKYFDCDIEKYIELGGFTALKKSMKNGNDFTINELKKSGIRGRGGAAYHAWKKWTAAKDRISEKKYVLCNADEGEPGTFKDRDLLKKDPFKVIEGMIIAAYTIGASEGFIYIREEYDDLRIIFNKAIKKLKEHNYLGNNILGTNFNFNIKAYTGAGAYICGENTALVESMHGRVGRPKLKPPRVGTKGLFDIPTMVNNVETFACVTTAIKYGDIYHNEGTEKSNGTKIISLSGNIKNPGTYEIPFGITLNEILNEIGGGTLDNSSIKFIQTGGASGPLIPSNMFDLKYTYEDFNKNNFAIGSGAIVVGDENSRIIDYLLSVQEFFNHESCGKCTPCREGTYQLVHLFKKLKDKTATSTDLLTIEKVSILMMETSFCGLGQTAPAATMTAIKYFKDELCENIKEEVNFKSLEN